MANMLLKITVALGSIALVAGGGSSLTSVSNLHGGSYAYGVDHDSYGAWYGTSQAPLYGGLGIGHGNLYEHGPALPQGDYGFATYGAGYGHGDYATSYQNSNLKSYGGEKVLHAGHSIHHGHGASSYSKIVQKFGHSGLYNGHDTYAGGYGHGHYAGHGISQQNFNLKSYAHPPVDAEPIYHAPIHDTIPYTHEPIIHHNSIPYIPAQSDGHSLDDLSSTYGIYDHGHESLGDFYGLGDYNPALSYSYDHIPYTPYHSYESPSTLSSYGNYEHYGYGHGTPYYHH